MKFNLEQAVSYLFYDNNLLKKLLKIYPLALFSILLSFCIVLFQFLLNGGFNKLVNHPVILTVTLLIIALSLIFSTIYSGYFTINTNLRIFKPENQLAELSNWKDFFINGLKIFFGFFAWQIIIQFVLFAAVILVLIVFGLLGIIIYYLFKETSFTFNSHAFVSFSIIVGFLILVIVLGLGILCGLMQIAAYFSFITNLDLESFFDSKKIKKIFIRNFKPFIKYIGWAILLRIIYGLIFIILSVTIIGIIFLPVLDMYCAAIYSDLQAQLLRHVFNIEKNH